MVVTNAGGCSTTSSGITNTVLAFTPAFTTQPGLTACSGSNVTYTTQSGQTGYTWVVPGVLNTDYSITSGGTGSTSYTVTLKWLTTGSKTVTVNYTNSGGCTAVSATSSTATNRMPIGTESPASDGMAATESSMRQPKQV